VAGHVPYETIADVLLPGYSATATVSDTGSATEAWETNYTRPREWDAWSAGYEEKSVRLTTGTMLVAVVVIGMLGTVLIGGVYCVRAYRSGNTSRYGRGGKGTDDTDPLLEDSPP